MSMSSLHGGVAVESASTPSVRRGDIFYADLSPVVGSEQGGMRPVLIIQNDVGNRYSPTVIAAAITSRMGKTKLPTHIDVMISERPHTSDRVGLAKDSVILLEQIRTLDKRRLREKMGHLDEGVMEEVNNAIAVSFGLHEGIRRGEERSAHSETPLQAPARDIHVYRDPIGEPRLPREPRHTAKAPVSPAAHTEFPPTAAASVAEEGQSRGEA